MATVREVAALGYEVVEFFSPYFTGRPNRPKTSANCSTISVSSASPPTTPSPTTSPRTSRRPSITTRSSAPAPSSSPAPDAPKPSTTGKRSLTASPKASNKLHAAGLRGGYHNHQAEFTPSKANAPSKCSPPTPPKNSCCSSTSAPASKWAPTLSPGSTPTLAVSAPCTQGLE